MGCNLCVHGVKEGLLQGSYSVAVPPGGVFLSYHLDV